MIALTPNDFNPTKGLIYSRDWMVLGTLAIEPFSADNKVNG